jgi:hypothetical protein
MKAFMTARWPLRILHICVVVLVALACCAGCGDSSIDIPGPGVDASPQGVDASTPTISPSQPSNEVTPVGPPGSPTNVVAARGNAQASVSWSAPASDGGSAITSYVVTSSPGGLTATVAAPATTTLVLGLTNGVSYTFAVVAKNVVGDGPASAASNAVTPGPVPGAPTGVAAVGGRGQATVSWSPAADGGEPITSYTITASPGVASATATGGATNVIVTGLTNGTSYTFTVKATNVIGTGLASAASNAVTPATEPDAPAGVLATIGNAAAQISWTAPNNGGSALSGYTVTTSPGGAVTAVGAPMTTTTIPGLVNGTAYTFTVFATNALGPGPASAASNAVTPTPCTLAGYTAKTATVSANGCALLDRDVSGCQAGRIALGLSGFWLKFSCRVTISKTTFGGVPVIQLQSDGQPDYGSFYFPTQDACYEAYPSGKPNTGSIVARTFRFSVPVTPVPVAGGVMTPGGSTGMAVNGVSLFDNRAKPGDDIYTEALTFDRCGAHPNVTGYHYHTEPYAISNDDNHFIGVQRDGYPVYGRRDPNGSMPVLDPQGGHTGFTIDSPAAAVYHYHVNEQTSTAAATAGQKQWFISKGRLNASVNVDCTGC